MSDERVNIVFTVVCLGVFSCLGYAQAHGPGAMHEPHFVASPIYHADGPVYALAGGEFDLAHPGIEVAALEADGSVVQLSRNLLTWEAALRFQGVNSVSGMATRPTIDIGDVHSGYAGGEIVVCYREPAILRTIFNDPNEGWSQQILDDKTDWMGSGWGARVGDYDPRRPGDEILYIFETVFDQSIATRFSEVDGIWRDIVVYGVAAAEVGMDSTVGDFNWERSGPEAVIVTEMGPTYEILSPLADANGVARRKIWDDPEDAGWVVKSADVDWRSPGDELVYGTRYNNKIMISRHTAGGTHEKEVIFTGAAIEHPQNMWDIAVGDVLVQSPGLEILGVDHTGSVYLLRQTADGWQGEAIWQDENPLYAVIVCDLLPQRSGPEILVAGEGGNVTLLVAHPF
jgi:hypothetical protein